MKLGFIGLGIMGTPMAGHLKAGGHDLFVTTRSKVPPVLLDAGAVACASAREVAANADIVFTMVPDTPDVEAVLFGRNGVAEGLSAGKTVVDMSSISPIETKAFAKKINALGCDYLDAPVSGGEVGAKAASLTIMVGGPEATFEKVKPLFQLMGKNITLVGGNGDGQTTKVANQIIVALNIAAVGEALVFASKAGADPAKVRQALMGGFAASRILEVHGERMIKRTFNPGFRIKLHQKDLALALAGARALGVALPQTAGAAQLMQACAANGMDELDHSALVRALELMARHDVAQGVMEPRALLRALYDAAVQRALPAHNTAAYLPPPPKGRTLVLGAGKAGGAMAAAVDALWPRDAKLSGLVVTRYDHVPPAYKSSGGRIEVVEARHPVPDEAGRRAAQRIADLARGLTADDLVLCLVSGGGSALLSLPAPGLTLEDKQAVNKALLDSGAAIDEMNCVRKHLSAIKGGRLAAMCAPAQVVTLLISDVPGDSPAVIASGPSVPDPTTCADALAILKRYGIAVPKAAQQGLESGAFETPKPDDPRFTGHAVHMIATPQQSLEAAAALARSQGIEAHILSDEIEGESREVGKVHAALARAVARRNAPFTKPCVILSGGETTVTVKQKGGRGGRATEFLLGCAIALQGEPGVHVLAADTDGIDGIEDNAGAIVTPTTLARAAGLGLKAADFLDRNDAYNFFKPLGDLVVPGPTFTNVNDFRALLIA